MIVHRGEVDVRRGHDVPQGDVAEAAIGIEPLGGGENGGPGLIARHGTLPFRHSRARRSREPGISGATISRFRVRRAASPRNDGSRGSCLSNACMKLSFEEPGMSIRVDFRKDARGPKVRGMAPQKPDQALAAEAGRADSPAQKVSNEVRSVPWISICQTGSRNGSAGYSRS